MTVQHPVPIMDLSSRGFIACVAAAGRSHVGSYLPHERPRLRADSRRRAWAADPERVCLYCGEPEPVGGEEHPLSVALGNWFWVIPPNVVCAACNHGVLSRLDTALVRHPLIAAIRTLAGITGRRGQPPDVAASNLRLARDAEGNLNAEIDHERFVRRDGDEVTFNATWTNFGPRHHRAVARALLKAALGVVWLARGPGETRQPRYDHARRAIAGDATVPLQHGFENSTLPGHALRIMVIGHESLEGISVSLDYFGIHLWVKTAGARTEAGSERLSIPV